MSFSTFIETERKGNRTPICTRQIPDIVRILLDLPATGRDINDATGRYVNDINVFSTFVTKDTWKIVLHPRGTEELFRVIAKVALKNLSLSLFSFI